jgi:hypothetical protein
MSVAKVAVKVQDLFYFPVRATASQSGRGMATRRTIRMINRGARVRIAGMKGAVRGERDEVRVCLSRGATCSINLAR